MKDNKVKPANYCYYLSYLNFYIFYILFKLAFSRRKKTQ